MIPCPWEQPCGATSATANPSLLLQDAVLPGWMPSLQMPTAPFDLTSFALSLLLVFRTNTRWDG